MTQEPTPGPGSVDSEGFSQTPKTPEISQANSVISKSPSNLSELHLVPENRSLPEVSEVKVAMRRISFRKGFSKYVPQIRWRKHLQKCESKDLEKAVCTVCKRNLLDTVEEQNAEVPNENLETKGETDSRK
jgi:hypothetical protein